MSLARTAVVFCFLLVSLGASACSSDRAAIEPTPSPTPSPTPALVDIIDICLKRADAEAKAKFGENAWGWSDDREKLTYRLMRVGAPYGVNISPLISDNFISLYQGLLGLSPWAQPQARALFDSVHAECLAEYGLGEGDLPSIPFFLPAEWSTAECVTRALVQTEQEYGVGSVDYTPEIITYWQGIATLPSFVQREQDYSASTGRSPDSYLFLAESSYQELTGQSPFLNPAAMQAFRARASECPEK